MPFVILHSHPPARLSPSFFYTIFLPFRAFSYINHTPLLLPIISSVFLRIAATHSPPSTFPIFRFIDPFHIILSLPRFFSLYPFSISYFLLFLPTPSANFPPPYLSSPQQLLHCSTFFQTCHQSFPTILHLPIDILVNTPRNTYYYYLIHSYIIYLHFFFYLSYCYLYCF